MRLSGTQSFSIFDFSFEWLFILVFDVKGLYIAYSFCLLLMTET